MRQLHRYAAVDLIDHLILVTSKPRHRAFMPSEIGGKSLTVVWIAGAL